MFNALNPRGDVGGGEPGGGGCGSLAGSVVYLYSVPIHTLYFHRGDRFVVYSGYEYDKSSNPAAHDVASTR